jgi:hypothetical protein
MRITLAFVLTSLALGACGGSGTDLSGMYQVTSISEDTNGCGAGTMPTNPPAFLHPKSQDLLGQTIWNVEECTANDPMSCSGDFVGFLVQEIPNGWSVPISSASGGMGSPCGYGYALETATLSKGVLTVESTFYAQTDTTPTQGMCSTDEAKKRGTTMPCKSHKIATATLVK